MNDLLQCLKNKGLFLETQTNRLSFSPQGIEIDSRQVQPNDLFVAIPGAHADGHQFVKSAEEKGACAAIVERFVKDVKIPQIRVKHARKSLACLANTFYGHPSKKLKLVGITGTNGKTTSTFLIKSFLDVYNLNAGIIGTNSYQWKNTTIPAPLTTPESHHINQFLKKMLDEHVKACVMEVSSHSIDMHRVTNLEFDVAAFTNLSHDHLDFYQTMENYYHSKRRFFLNSEKQIYKKPIAVLNIDDEWGKRLHSEITNMPVITYGIHDPADVSITDYKLNLKKTNFTLSIDEMAYSIETCLLGKHNLYNILTAISILKALDMPFRKNAIQSVLNKIQIKGRLQPIDEGQDFSVLVDFAHTPDALDKVLENCKKIKGNGRMITVFGAGGDRDREKRPVMGKVAAMHSDVVIVTSDNPRTEDPRQIINDVKKGIPEEKDFIECIDRRDAIAKAIQMAQPDDVVIIAGKGHEDYQIIGEEKIHFDDGEVVREIFRSFKLNV